MGFTEKRYEVIQAHFRVSDPVAVIDSHAGATFLFDVAASAAQHVLDAVQGEAASHRALRTALRSWRERISVDRPGETLTWELFFATGAPELTANGLQVIPADDENGRVYLGDCPVRYADRQTGKQLTFGF